MTIGVKENIVVRVKVYTRRFGVLSFGLATNGFPGGSVPHTGDGNDLVSVGWSRTLAKDQNGAQAGQLAFALPGRRYGAVGHAWSELISPNDTVELLCKVDRSPDDDGEYSKDWWTEFVGEVRTVKLDNDDSVVLCQDAMGRLAYEHFSYWRNLGEAVGNGNEKDIQKRLGKVGLHQAVLMNNSIAGAAEAIFEALLYTRLSTRIKWGDEEHKWSDLHGYRFESDDFNVVTDLQSLAPEGTSWGDAVGWAVDAPEWYEFYLDNVPEDELKTRLANGGKVGAGLSRPQQIKRKAPGKVFTGKRIERFVIRPAPFPVYDPQRGGYNGAAWDNLPTTVAWPWGVEKVDVSRDRDHIYSVYSVDLVNGNTQGTDNADNSSAQAQVVVDGERYTFHTGYRPLDARSKRVAVAGQTYTASQVEFARALGWQLLSFHHFNDRFYSGEIKSSFDWRPRLGTRYIAEGYLYYVEGYSHAIDAGGAESTFTVTRGLTLPQYGVKMQGPAVHMLGRAAEEAEWQQEWRLFPDHLGRLRPGETYPPKAQNTEDNRFLDEIGKHEDFTP